MVLRRPRPPGLRHATGRWEGKSIIFALGLLCLSLVVWTNGKFLKSTITSSIRAKKLEAIDAELAQILVAEHHGAWERVLNETTPKANPVLLVRSNIEMGQDCQTLAHGAQKPESRTSATLVVYIYNAEDAEQQHNFLFFVNYAISADDGVTYRIAITTGGKVLAPPSQPALPANAEYMQVSECTGSWGVLGALSRSGLLPPKAYTVVVDSSVRGPFLPSYVSSAMHWTEAFTSRLTGIVKMVGSVISCEGAPRGGHAAMEWRLNPHIIPYAWATDAEGWTLLVSDPTIMRCYDSPWDTKYYSDVGAGMAMLRAGYNLDSLLTRYQGVDWWSERTWECNGRVRPDGEMQYDGASITPYETMFVRVDVGKVQAEWTFVRAALKYQQWMKAAASYKPVVNSNEWTVDPWRMRAAKMAAMNARGPGCFDFDYYVSNNPDVASEAGDPLRLWEHWLLLGQFQGRTHRFSCPVQMGSSYRIAYLRARGGSCFDHNYYLEHNKDLKGAGMTSSAELFGHYTYFGQFEQRPVRFSCPDTWHDLAGGYETIPVGTEQEVQLSLRAFAATTLEGRGLIQAPPNKFSRSTNASEDAASDIQQFTTDGQQAATHDAGAAQEGAIVTQDPVPMADTEAQAKAAAQAAGVVSTDVVTTSNGDDMEAQAGSTAQTAVVEETGTAIGGVAETASSDQHQEATTTEDNVAADSGVTVEGNTAGTTAAETHVAAAGGTAVETDAAAAGATAAETDVAAASGTAAETNVAAAGATAAETDVAAAEAGVTQTTATVD